MPTEQVLPPERRDQPVRTLFTQLASYAVMGSLLRRGVPLVTVVFGRPPKFLTGEVEPSEELTTVPDLELRCWPEHEDLDPPQAQHRLWGRFRSAVRERRHRTEYSDPAHSAEPRDTRHQLLLREHAKPEHLVEARK